MSESAEAAPQTIVRATVRKFNGNPPTRANDALRRMVLLGPKQPVEIVVFDGENKTVTSEPVDPVPKAWVMFYVKEWVVEVWKKIVRRVRNAID